MSLKLSRSIVLLGHRGVGKTTFMCALHERHPDLKVYDLDQEIINRYGPIEDLFLNHGEDYFRKLEQVCFKNILNKNKSEHILISVGAGFETEKWILPHKLNWIQLQRQTDLCPRIFLDRPKLDQALTDPEEYLFRKSKRDLSWKKMSGKTPFLIPEGQPTDQLYQDCLDVFAALIEKRPIHSQSYATLNSELMLSLWINAYSNWELKTDIFSVEEMGYVLASQKEFQKFLVSVRTPLSEAEVRELVKLKEVFKFQLDIDEAYLPSFKEPLKLNFGVDSVIISSHEQTPPESNPGTQLKWSPEITDQSQMKVALDWFMNDREQRSLLPRGCSGRWAWARELLGFQNLNFSRLDYVGSAPEQPPYFRDRHNQKKDGGFLGLVGHQISHSRTPSFHSRWAGMKNLELKVFDVWPEDFELFKSLFLIQDNTKNYLLAITSPFKSLWGDGEASNTFVKSKSKSYKFTSTDDVGMQALLIELRNLASPAPYVVWGGGGVLGSIKSVLPEALLYSARTGEPRCRSTKTPEYPVHLIWAAGQIEPPRDWPFDVLSVLDLSYHDHSPAIAIAKRLGVKYLSGAAMFEAQALAQQEFWSQHI